MKQSASIAGKLISADQPYVVFSHTNGLVAQAGGLDEAQRALDRERSLYAEWGKDTDAAIFRWDGHAWRPVDLAERAEVSPPFGMTPSFEL